MPGSSSFRIQIRYQSAEVRISSTKESLFPFFDLSFTITEKSSDEFIPSNSSLAQWMHDPAVPLFVSFLSTSLSSVDQRLSNGYALSLFREVPLRLFST
jgi:hypothetical protein